MKTLIAAAALLLTATPALAQTAPAAAPAADSVATIYDKALSPGWENWSWAKTELSADIGSARMPIMMDAQAYGGLYLHHAPFSTAPYRALSMLIQVVGGPAKVRVMVTVGGKAIPDGDKMEGGQPVNKMKLVTLAPGGWTQILVPLGVLGAENVTADGIMVMNDSGEPAPHIYVADIAFKP
ncbi:MAG: hypothetical protein V4574_02550 [Pseudomonadota bacterium]